VVAAALSVAVLPAYLILAACHSVPVARAAAMLGWLAGRALIAWSLRTQPRLPLRANLAFPRLGGSRHRRRPAGRSYPAGDAIRLSPLPAAAAGVVAGLITAAVIISAGARTALHLGSRL
jgi:hypothetical protein